MYSEYGPATGNASHPSVAFNAARNSLLCSKALVFI